LEKLGFAWILSSESSLFKGLRWNFGGTIFVGVRRRDVRLVAGLEIVDEAVDLVEQPLPFLRAVTVFRYDRLLMLVESVDHPLAQNFRDDLANPLASLDRTRLTALSGGSPLTGREDSTSASAM
jgi:hypothetical protein